MRHQYAFVMMLALATTAACGDGRSMPQPTPAAKASPPAFTPMTEADIRRHAIACLQSPAYPLDGGPQCLRADGSWILYSGWGNPTGRYRIEGNRVILMPQPGAMMPRPETTIAFFRDRAGAMHLSYDGEPSLRPLRPYPESDYVRLHGIMSERPR